MSAPARQVVPVEERFADELAFMAAYDNGPRPPGWRLTPRAVVTFVVGSGGEELMPPADERPDGRLPARVISRKYVGDDALVERAVVTLAGERGLLLVGEPGTAKSMLSELMAAAVCGTSGLTVQGTAGTTEDQLRYGWNYALLLAQGPSEAALVPSPVMWAMRRGQIARVEEITRCLPEIQDSLVSLLSDRRIAIPELDAEAAVAAAPGFTLIATANLRDRGVSEMSAALKRRFNFEMVHPIDDQAAEVALVMARTAEALERAGSNYSIDANVVEVLITTFRDLRRGRSPEGWVVERPTTIMSTAEAVAVATSLALAAAYFPDHEDLLGLLPEHLLGVVRKDDPVDAERLLGYWDGVVRRRAEDGAGSWARLWEQRSRLER